MTIPAAMAYAHVEPRVGFSRWRAWWERRLAN
jgi:hypothetical protein